VLYWWLRDNFGSVDSGSSYCNDSGCGSGADTGDRAAVSVKLVILAAVVVAILASLCQS
jgi:hypothetical protein